MAVVPPRNSGRDAGSVAPIVVANIFASVGIILVNKQIASVCGFHFLLTLIFLNFLSTGSVTALLARLRHFEVRHLPFHERLIGSLLCIVTVLLNNASNEANSVGFYQITKLLIIPTVIGFERLSGVWRSYTNGIVLSLLVTSMGVAMATVSDFEVNARGTALACMSIIFTARYQMWQSSKQKEYNISAMQITHTVGAPQIVLGFAFTMVFDVLFPWLKGFLLLPEGGLLDYQFQRRDILWIILCCFIAVGMNLSTYGLLGKTSPVTYQVVGQVKTCLIVGLGYFLFDVRAPTAMWLALRFGGAVIGMTGAFAYAKLKTSAAKDEVEQKGR